MNTWLDIETFNFQRFCFHNWNHVPGHCHWSAWSVCVRVHWEPALQRDRNHLVTSRTSFFHKCCHCSGACLGIQMQHKEIIARPVIICLSAAEWRELLTFYFRVLVWVFSSKEATEKQKRFCHFFCSAEVNPFLFSTFVFSRGKLSSAFTAIMRAYLLFSS